MFVEYREQVDCQLACSDWCHRCMQEVQFNMSFCRCAIKAAVAHETHAFKSSPNSQKYHVSLTRQPPALANVDFDTLSTLCQQYSQPVPAHHPQHAERSTAAMGAVDTSTGVASQTVTGTGTHEAVQGLQQQQQNINQGYEALGLDPTASDSPQCAADGANARSEPSGAAEQPAAGSEDGHCSASVLDSRIQEPEISGAVHGKLKRLREACEEEEGAPSAVKAYVDALFESDEDWPAHVAASGCDHVHDINIPESLPHMPELSGGAAVAGSEEEYVPGSPGSADVGPCEQARVGAAVATGSSAEKAASGASQVWSRVREFVSMCLEPWLVSGAVDDEESEVILDKCVSKVLSAHAGRKDAAFLDAEGERIQALVAKYADFVVSKSKK